MRGTLPSVEIFYDVSSPWTYLAFHRLEQLEATLGARFLWRPILVGGIFNTANPSVYQSREQPVPAKARYLAKDLQDWARHTGLAIVFPPKTFPVNSVKAMRGCLVAAREGRQPAFARAAFEAYWGENRDIADDAVLAGICERVGLAPGAFFGAIGDPSVKAELKANTDEAIARGAFGTPTVFVDRDDMYFGNDRLPLIAQAIERGRAA